MPVTSAQRFFEERRLNEHVEYGSVELVWEAFSGPGAREICTLAINFPRRDMSPRRTSKWSAYGWTLTIEPHWKPTLRGLLKESGVTADSIYPPVEEVRRLLSYWAEKIADAET